MIRTCSKCNVALPVHKGRHRPRKFCVLCRPPRLAKGAPTTSTAVVMQMAQDDPQHSLVAAVEAKLVEVDKRNDPVGVLLVKLAASIDEGGHSGASLAALSREVVRVLSGLLGQDAGADAEIVEGVEWGVV